jgi:hypothetical protein
MADVPQEPSFESPTYIAIEIPKWLHRFTIGEVVAPAPVTSATVRPTKGQGFPIGGE